MAPPTKRRKRDPAAAAAAPAIDPADRLSKLPEEILSQILSFLPAQEAVRTCVLARACRDVWKLTRGLLITGSSVQEVRGFVDPLLRLRLRGPSLDACEIMIDAAVDEFGDPIHPLDNDPEGMSSVNSWIRRALQCQVRTLRVDMGGLMDDRSFLQMCTRPLASPHLTKLELRGVWTRCKHLDFSYCPALERLEISFCNFMYLRMMASPSLRHLLITSCESVDDPCRFQICAPRLVSLRLEDMQFRTPLLESMPDLVGAYVQIGSFWDNCSCDHPMGCYHVTRAGHISESELEEDSDLDDYAEQIKIKCVLLEGLAQAKDLVLMAKSSTYIIRRDLRWCPTFSKLKTLVLEDHLCEPADCSPLACILEHAPVLEKLVIFSRQARGKYKVEVKGSLDATIKSTMVSHHLKIVEIKCQSDNKNFLNILNFLGTLNICFQIRVTEK